MTSVQRYSLQWHEAAGNEREHSRIEPDTQGGFVRYSDLLALEKRVEEMRDLLREALTPVGILADMLKQQGHAVADVYQDVYKRIDAVVEGGS